MIRRTSKMEPLGEDLSKFVHNLRQNVRKFEESKSEQSSDFQQLPIGVVFKVLDSTEKLLSVIMMIGAGTDRLVPVFNFMAIAPVVFTGIKYVTIAGFMIQTAIGERKDAQILMNQSIGDLKKSFEKIEKIVDEMDDMVGIMLALHEEGAETELEIVVTMFEDKLGLIKTELDICNRELSKAKIIIDQELQKLNFTVPLVATAAGIAGAAALGIFGVILTPFVVGAPMIAAAAAGGTVMTGGCVAASVYAVKFQNFKKTFLIHKAEQELLCDDLEHVTERVKAHVDVLRQQNISVISPWEISISWSLQLEYSSIPQLPAPQMSQ